MLVVFCCSLVLYAFCAFRFRVRFVVCVSLFLRMVYVFFSPFNVYYVFVFVFMLLCCCYCWCDVFVGGCVFYVCFLASLFFCLIHALLLPVFCPFLLLFGKNYNQPNNNMLETKTPPPQNMPEQKQQQTITTCLLMLQ